MKHICVKCERFMRPKKNGFMFVEGMSSDGAKPGLVEPEKWRGYKLWAGDLWQCPDCQVQVVVGCARMPIAEHYQPDFDHKVKSFGVELLVKDC